MSNEKNNMNKEVIKEFLNTYKEDLLDFDKCKAISENLLTKKSQIKSQLNVDNEEGVVGKYVCETKEYVNKCDISAEKSKSILKEIEVSLDEVDDVRKCMQDYSNKLNALQSTLQYMKVIQRMEFLSVELQREYKKQDDEQCATIFVNLCEISRNLCDFPAQHLKNYLKETLHYWHSILKDKLSRDFDDVLVAIKWPFVNANFSLAIPSQANIQKLQILTEYLLQIELPTESTNHNIVTSGFLSDFSPLSLPIQFLVSPLRKRFIYHFYGNRQTNRADKPEWYLTQILTWIRDHREFLQKWIQPVIDKLGLHHIDAKLELTRGLVQLAAEKLYNDLPSIQYDDFTFSHSIDEALGFDKELRENYNYPQNQPSILAVLTQAQIFLKWLTMEKKYAIEKMDAILSPSSLNAFEPLTSDIEDLKITTCADAFITLLQTIMERYECLPQPGHRLQFLDLQLELLDDFRVRLLQLVHAEQGDVIESKIPMIANTIHYIETVLIDWGTMLHYLNLYYYNNQLESEKSTNLSLNDFEEFVDAETETVFAETLSLYSHMRRDLICTLSEYVVMEIKAKSKSYRKERWSQLKMEKDIRSVTLTPSACPMFEIIARRLHQLEKSLTKKLFLNVWKSIAGQIDTYLFEDLVLDSRFNEGGAFQFKYDVTRNLLPIFSQYTEQPEYYFTQLLESIILLTISKGSALLLKETLLALEGATGIEDQRSRALKEIGVINFTPKMSVTVLNQRTDITVNRLSVD